MFLRIYVTYGIRYKKVYTRELQKLRKSKLRKLGLKVKVKGYRKFTTVVGERLRSENHRLHRHMHAAKRGCKNRHGFGTHRRIVLQERLQSWGGPGPGPQSVLGWEGG